MPAAPAARQQEDVAMQEEPANSGLIAEEHVPAWEAGLDVPEYGTDAPQRVAEPAEQPLAGHGGWGAPQSVAEQPAMQAPSGAEPAEQPAMPATSAEREQQQALDTAVRQAMEAGPHSPEQLAAVGLPSASAPQRGADDFVMPQQDAALPPTAALDEGRSDPMPANSEEIVGAPTAVTTTDEQKLAEPEQKQDSLMPDIFEAGEPKERFDPPGGGGGGPEGGGGGGGGPRRPGGGPPRFPSGPPDGGGGPPAPAPPPGIGPKDLMQYYMRMNQFGYAVPQQYQPPVVIAGGGGASSSAAATGASGAGAAGGSREDLELKHTMRKILEELQKKKGTAKRSALDTTARKQLGARKKEYNALRKDKLKTLNARQKQELQAVKVKLKTIPRKERTTMGKTMRAAIKEKYTKLKKQFPTSAKKTISEMSSLLKGIKALRV